MHYAALSRVKLEGRVWMHDRVLWVLEHILPEMPVFYLQNLVSKKHAHRVRKLITMVDSLQWSLALATP